MPATTSPNMTALASVLRPTATTPPGENPTVHDLLAATFSALISSGAVYMGLSLLTTTVTAANPAAGAILAFIVSAVKTLIAMKFQGDHPVVVSALPPTSYSGQHLG